MSINKKLIIGSILFIFVGGLLSIKTVTVIGNILKIIGWVGLLVALVNFIKIKRRERKKPKTKK